MEYLDWKMNKDKPTENKNDELENYATIEDIETKTDKELEDEL